MCHSYPRSPEDEVKSDGVWLKGHTGMSDPSASCYSEETKHRHADFGSITVLWSQPVAALQILSRDGKWRWVKHIDNACVRLFRDSCAQHGRLISRSHQVINSGDSMEFLSGGHYKPTIHRVVLPPEDQQGYPRLGAFYFAIPDDSVKLAPFAESPVLQREGIKRRFDDEHAPTAEVWRKGRTAAYGKTELKKGRESGVEEEYVGGILVKHYN